MKSSKQRRREKHIRRMNILSSIIAFWREKMPEPFENVNGSVFFFILVSFLIPFYLIRFVWANARYNRMEVTEHQCHTLTRLFGCWINFDNFLRIRLNECNDAIWFCIYTLCMRVWMFSFFLFFLILSFIHSFDSQFALLNPIYWWRFRIFIDWELVALFVRVCVCASWLVLLFCRSCSCHRRCRRV